VPWSDGFPVYTERLVNGKPVPDKHDVPKQGLKWDFTQASKFRIGKYSAKLLVVYDNGTEDVPLEATVSFWVVPWKLLLVVLIVLVIIGFGVFTVVRSLLRKARGSAKKVSKLRRHGKR
jgi:hypothetical protein